MTRKQQFTEGQARGIHSIADVKDRCVIDDETGCWHWRGAVNKNPKTGKRTPMLWMFDPQANRVRAMTGPLAVLELVGRRTLSTNRGWRTCLCDDCMNPGHIAGGTNKDFGRWVRGNDLWKNDPKRIATQRRTGRARSILTAEIVRTIRSSPLNGRQLAAQFGLQEQLVSKVRCHRTWPGTVAPGASVFTLGARNA